MSLNIENILGKVMVLKMSKTEQGELLRFNDTSAQNRFTEWNNTKNMVLNKCLPYLGTFLLLKPVLNIYNFFISYMYFVSTFLQPSPFELILVQIYWHVNTSWTWLVWPELYEVLR